jgi:hypothetical protein
MHSSPLDAAIVTIDEAVEALRAESIRRLARQPPAGSSPHALEILHNRGRPVDDIKLPLEKQPKTDFVL